MRQSNDADREGLRAAIGGLRRELPPGSSIAVVGSIRSRDRAEITTGDVFPLQLASPLLFDQQYGQYSRIAAPHVQIFEGVLGYHHIANLLPVLEQAARNKTTIVIAASDIDESVLAMLVMNKQRNTINVSALLGDSGNAGLRAFAQSIGAKPGVARDQLSVEPAGTARELIATLHETIVLADPRINPRAGRVGLLHVGGADALEVRERVATARELISPGAA